MGLDDESGVGPESIVETAIVRDGRRFRRVGERGVLRGSPTHAPTRCVTTRCVTTRGALARHRPACCTRPARMPVRTERR